nr:MAG TPA: hypothetical protein [Caudoviricetes sp.]
MDWEQWSFFDLISVLSFIVGLQNLDLNKKQVDSMMSEMRDNQNAMLSTIISQNKEIIKLLKEK